MIFTLLFLAAIAFVVKSLFARKPLPPTADYKDSTPDEIPDYSDSKEPVYACNADSEIKVRVAKKGIAAEKPVTVMEVFKRAVERHGDKLALAIERGGDNKWQHTTWREYYEQTMCAARALVKIGMPRFGSVNIIGFNSPEWLVSNLGAIAAGGKAVGIYTTNGNEACHYVSEHSEATVVVVENEAQLAKFLAIRDRLPALKKIVQWDGKIPEKANAKGKVEVIDWPAFMALGKGADEGKLQAEVDDRIAATRPGHCCTLIYTSGTTGNPKAVMISNDNVTWTSRASLATMPGAGSEPERCISYLPLSHIAAQMTDIHVPMATTAFYDFPSSIYFARPDALKGSLPQTLRAVRPTAFLGVPRVWEKMEERMKEIGRSSKGLKKAIATFAKQKGLEGFTAGEVGGSGLLPPLHWLADKLVLSKVRAQLGLDKARVCYTGAAPISKDTLAYLGSLGIAVCELYGMSECTGPQTVSLPNYRRVGSCGPNMPGVEMKIEHVDGRDKPNEGEICFRGRHIMMGYLKQADKTKESIDAEGFMHSGDVGRVDRNGLVYITGRIKELLITAGGENVAPVPVEDAVKKELPGISNCMMVGDRKKFNTILITLRTEINADTGVPSNQLTGEALRVSEASKTVEQAQKDPAWQKYIKDGIDRANKQAVSRAQVLQKFAVLDRDFSIPGGELTPTLKLKRAVVCEKYARVIDGLYEGADG